MIDVCWLLSSISYITTNQPQAYFKGTDWACEGFANKHYILVLLTNKIRVRVPTA